MAAAARTAVDPRRAALVLGAIVAIWAIVGALVMKLDRPAVAMAGAVDLTVTCSLVIYLGAVRPGHLPRWVMTLIAVAGALAARMLLARAPGAARVGLAAGLEAFALGMVFIRGSRATGVIATEARVLGYALTGWRAPRRGADTFTVHRASGWPLYAGVFVALTLLETGCMHLVLFAAGHPLAAWIATALSLYSALWLVGDALALRHGGIVVTRNTIELRVGVRWRGRIARTAIASVERGAAPPGALNASIIEANVVLRLVEPCTLDRLFGRKRSGNVVALSIDDPDRFIAALRRARRCEQLD
jgi:hypothetical protein